MYIGEQRSINEYKEKLATTNCKEEKTQKESYKDF